jgi:predicted nucleic-acid-binding protein
VIGLDTNVVLRLVDQRDAAQTAAARRLVAESIGEGGCVLNPIVLAEFAWTLERQFRFERASVAQHLEGFLGAAEFVVPFAEQARAALTQFRAGPANFADYFLAEINRSLGCETTYTFDRAAAESDGFTLLAN